MKKQAINPIKSHTMKSLYRKAPLYWRKLLPLIMILVMIKVSDAQENYRNKPWKTYAKEHSDLVLDNKGEVLQFPQYFNVVEETLKVELKKSQLILNEADIKPFLKYKMFLKNGAAACTKKITIDNTTDVFLGSGFQSNKKLNIEIAEGNKKADSILKYMNTAGYNLEQHYKDHVDSLEKLDGMKKGLNTLKQKVDKLNKKIEYRKKRISEGEADEANLDAFIDILTADISELENKEKKIVKQKKDIIRLSKKVAAFNRYYLSPKTIIYRGEIYLSINTKARYMRNHYANKGFEAAKDLRKEYYDHEDLYYLMHNFNGNEKLFKLEPTGEAIKDHKPNWVSDANSIIDGLGTVLDVKTEGLIQKRADGTKDYPSILKKIIDNNRKNPATLGQTIELKEEKRKFELPATVSYTISEYKKPDGEVKKKYTFDKPFKAYKRERFQIQGSLNWDVLRKERIELDPSGSNLNPSLESNKVQFMAGVKYYPWKSEIEDPRALVMTKYRWSIIGGMSIPKPLENIYLGAAYDIYPGINVNATCLWYQYEEFEVEDGKVIDTDKRYKPTLSMGIGIDASIFVKLIKLLNR